MSIKDFEALNPTLFNKLPDKRADDSSVHAPLDDVGLWLPDPATHGLSDLEIEAWELEAGSAYKGGEATSSSMCECGVESVGSGKHSIWCKLYGTD